MANQMLACLALCVATTMLINAGKAKYAWVTGMPMVFIAIIEMTAGYQNIAINYWPMTNDPKTSFNGYLNTLIVAALMIGLVIVMIGSARKWYRVLVINEQHHPNIYTATH